VNFFHGLQVAIMLTLMLNLVQFVWWTCKSRRSHLGSVWQVQKPTLIVLLAAILVNIQPMWILVIGSWQLCCSSCEGWGMPKGCTPGGKTYPPWSDGNARTCSLGGNVFWDESYCDGGKYPIFPTQWQGWTIQILCTWGGFVFMFIGVMQATSLHKKFIGKWGAIRRGQTGTR